MLLQDPLLAYAGHTFRYASVGGAEFAENQPGSKSNQSIKRTYSDSAKEVGDFVSIAPSIKHTLCSYFIHKNINTT